MMDFNLSFVWIRFFVALVFTLLPFLWVRRCKSNLEKLYFLFILLLIFAYSGIGAAWEDTPAEYTFKYVVYILVFGITCSLTVNNKKKKNIIAEKEELRYTLVERFIKRYGSFFVTLYVVLPLIRLAFAGKLYNLISPPTVNIFDVTEARFEARGMVESVLYYIENLVLPFYYLCLFKYKNNIIKLIFALLLPLYFIYASNGYIARSSMLPQAIIIYIAVYLKYPEYRKKIAIVTAVGIPFLMFALSFYTFLRMGSDFNLSFSDAIYLLLYSETSYPIHYAEVQKWPLDTTLLYTYFDWLIKLPFPGFVKSTELDYAFTAYFSEKMLGIGRTAERFYILLPGVVGEALFIFGKYFYWIHAMLLGFIVSKAYKLVHHKQELFLVLYMSIFCGLCIARAGTVSAYPFYFKHLIIYLIVIYFVTKPKGRQNNVTKATEDKSI